MTSARFFERVASILNDISYKPDRGYSFVTYSNLDDVDSIQIELRTTRPDTFTGEYGTGYGGLRTLYTDYTDDQIVRILFGACMAYEEHEVREAFQYRYRRIFGPHISIQALHSIADHIEIRQPS